MIDHSDAYGAKNPRSCAECGQEYSRQESHSVAALYFEAPYHYDRGCDQYCLACWLEVRSPDPVRND